MNLVTGILSLSCQLGDRPLAIPVGVYFHWANEWEELTVNGVIPGDGWDPGVNKKGESELSTSSHCSLFPLQLLQVPSALTSLP